MNSITVLHDLRGRLGPARDQEGRETCLAFAMSDAHAATLGPPWAALSCEYVFYHAKQRDKTSPHDGTTIPAIRAAIKDDGQPVETAWPYLKSLPANLKSWKPPTKVGTIFRRASKVNGLAFDGVWDCIEADQPAVITMTFSPAFLQPDENGAVDSPEPEEQALRHAILAVATGTRGKKKFILVRNSWGDTWGVSGYAWLSERYMAARIKAAITIN